MKPRNPIKVNLRIQIAAEALQKLWLWVDLAEGEVSALGLVERLPGALRITDFILVDQRCDAAETEMESAAIAELMLQLEAQGIDQAKLRCWAHSHGDMRTFWSGQDDACIVGLANDDWLLSLVVNKKREALMRLDQFRPCHLFLDDIIWETYYPLDQNRIEQWTAEFKRKVTESVSVIPVSFLEDEDLFPYWQLEEDRHE